MDAKKSFGITIILCFILLSGCAKNPTVIQYVDRPVEVKVPVTVYPDIKPIVCPKLPIFKLNEQSTNSEIAEAYVRSVKIQRGCLKLMEESIKAVRQKE